tara:strand:+ start:1829 stop:2071 length:243 start_codon:yes stop_codon:yes gene_type:complete
MVNKVIYLKSIFKGLKPNKKVTKLIDDAIVKSEVLAPVKKKKSIIDSRQFILKNTEDFLFYAVDYSLQEKFDSTVWSPEE